MLYLDIEMVLCIGNFLRAVVSGEHFVFIDSP